VVRAVGGDPALIKQLLDIGAQTLLIPMVDTAEQARALIPRYRRRSRTRSAARRLAGELAGCLDAARAAPTHAAY
jgi:2-keto-3-deoxy-L-rhamnonate aldolase RhmA